MDGYIVDMSYATVQATLMSEGGHSAKVTGSVACEELDAP